MNVRHVAGEMIEVNFHFRARSAERLGYLVAANLMIQKKGKRSETCSFTLRGENIRIFGAGLWREGKQVYEKENKIS